MVKKNLSALLFLYVIGNQVVKTYPKECDLQDPPLNFKNATFHIQK